MNTARGLLLTLWVLALCASSSRADTLIVPSADYPTIQSALDAGNGDSIRLLDGTYKEHDLDFKGHFCTLTSFSNDPAKVTIDAEFKGRVFHFHTGENAWTRLEAVTIVNGGAPDQGGGILCDGASPTISNCIITGNFAPAIAVPDMDSTGGAGIACINGAAPTILGCQINYNNCLGLGGGVLCRKSGNARIAYCTITGNYGTGDEHYGGGIGCDRSNAMVDHNEITSNTAAVGGGIFCMASSAPIILANHIAGNTATTGAGGGIGASSCNVQILGNVIDGNIADASYGGGVVYWGIEMARIEGNTIRGNQAALTGGGIFISRGEHNEVPTHLIYDNTITRNTAGTTGAGIFCIYVSPAIVGNRISGNQTTDGDGGGILCIGKGVLGTPVPEPDIRGNVISENTANGGNGGGICASAANPTLANNTLSRNLAKSVEVSKDVFVGGRGGGVYAWNGSKATVTNCILWDDGEREEGPELGVAAGVAPSTLTVTYSDVQGGQSAVYVAPGCTLNWGALAGGADNLDMDPRFAAATDLHLKSMGGRYAALFGLPPTDPLAWVTDVEHSPCIDSGDPASAWAGEPAPNGQRINMGAYGGTAQASKSYLALRIAVTKYPPFAKRGAAIPIGWSVVDLPPRAKITLNRVEWGTSTPAITRGTATDKKAPFAASFKPPRTANIAYFRVHAVINGVTLYSNVLPVQIAVSAAKR